MYTESHRARALLVALVEREITLDEFGDGVLPLTSEAAQVMATIIGGLTTCTPEALDHLAAARILCCRLASATRALS